MNDTKEKFSIRTISLHWIVALGVLTALGLGLYVEDMKDSDFKFWLYGIHKSIGVLVFPFALYRIFWRTKNGFPIPVGVYSKIEHILAKIVHYVLIIATILLPISGMMMSGLGGYGIPLFGLELVAPNFVDGKAIALNGTLAGIGHEIHEYAGDALLVALGLHFLGALKHHIIDKDGTLRRMLGKSV